MRIKAILAGLIVCSLHMAAMAAGHLPLSPGTLNQMDLALQTLGENLYTTDLSVRETRFNKLYKEIKSLRTQNAEHHRLRFLEGFYWYQYALLKERLGANALDIWEYRTREVEPYLDRSADFFKPLLKSEQLHYADRARAHYYYAETLQDYKPEEARFSYKTACKLRHQKACKRVKP